MILLKFPKDKRIGGANSWGANTDCHYCKNKAKWSMHGRGKQNSPDHIGVCDKYKCITKGLRSGYCGCGCGG
jgi:hypothetical protein